MNTITIRAEKALFIMFALALVFLIISFIIYLEANAMLIRAVDHCTTTNIKPWWNP